MKVPRMEVKAVGIKYKDEDPLCRDEDQGEGSRSLLSLRFPRRKVYVSWISHNVCLSFH